MTSGAYSLSTASVNTLINALVMFYEPSLVYDLAQLTRAGRHLAALFLISSLEE